ncbi:ABC transporter permease subunit [bacterium]|nr:ABC transporter permease subunit [bacterium]
MRAAWIIAKNVIEESIRKKEIYVLFILSVAMMSVVAMASFFSLTGLIKYFTELSFLIITYITVIIAVVVGARQVPTELNSRTIYPLMAKPLKRSEFIIGKWLGTSLISIFCFLVFEGIFIVLLFSKGSGISCILIQGIFLHILQIMLISSIVICLSTFMTNAANATVSILYFILGYWIGKAISDALDNCGAFLAWILRSINYILPHLDYFDLSKKIVHQWQPVPAWVIITVMIYAVVYISIFLLIGTLKFQRKQL